MNDDLKKLTQMQYYVTQEAGTEPPFENEFCNFFEDGLYLDVVSDEVLFASLHKFHSPCGWPAFYKSIARENIVHLEDKTHGMNRVEVRSKNGNSHLGHVFTDGPAPTGVRYCINSAALKFIPRAKLSEHNLDEYETYFTDSSNKINTEREVATLGAGCFWGVQAILSKIKGVIKTTSGYCGGDLIDPTYEQICTGKTGHAEVVQVEFDPSIITYVELLKLFFRLHDPTTLNSQGYDIGTQYRSVIFYHSENQLTLAKELIEKLTREHKYKSPIVTKLDAFETFYSAEDYHQDYYDKKYNGGFGPICHYLRDE